MNPAPDRASLSRGERFLRLNREQRIEVLRRLVAAERTAEIPAVIPPLDGIAPHRLSPAQEDLWAYETLYPGASLNLSVRRQPPHANISKIRRLRSPLRLQLNETAASE